jgi:transposase
MIDAIRYLVDNGIKWRSMPSNLPPWPRAYAFFTRWRDAGLVAELHDRLRDAVREAEDRDQELSAAVIDSQSVNADAPNMAKPADDPAEVRAAAQAAIDAPDGIGTVASYWTEVPPSLLGRCPRRRR